MSYPHRMGVAIAIPHTGRALPPAWAWALANLHPSMNCNVVWMSNLDTTTGQVKTGEIDALRNWFVEQAQSQNCKYLFFLDEDVVVPPHSLRQLLYQMEQHPEISVIGGVYCSKTDPPEPLVFNGNGAGPYWDWKVGECFEVSGLGMGCTIIRLSALDLIEKPYFKTVDDASKFLDGKAEMEAWTEDLYFCERVTESGGHCYVDSAVMCAHYDLKSMKPYFLRADSRPVKGLPEMANCLVIGAFLRKLNLVEYTPTASLEMGWTDSDFRGDPGRIAFDSEQFDEVVVLEALECWYPNQLDTVAKEWLRLLKPGGTLHVWMAMPESLQKWTREQLTEFLGRCVCLHEDQFEETLAAAGLEIQYGLPVERSGMKSLSIRKPVIIEPDLP